VSTREPFRRLEGVGLVLGSEGQKISKRLGNGVPLDEVLERFGADTTRLYIMFMSSYHDAAAFKMENMVGPRRFIERVWAMQYRLKTSPNLSLVGEEHDSGIETLVNQTIKKVGEDYEKLSFNTAISQMMILANKLEEKREGDVENLINEEYYKILLKLLAPLCPFFTEEIWDEATSIHLSEWPKYDESKIKNQKVNIAIQINGKVRGLLENVDADLSDEDVLNWTKKTESYQKWVIDIINGKEPKKVIIIKNKIINIVL
jgi:leucyl-tRNA synthetase